MPLLLNIDTATEYASVCISRDNTILSAMESTNQKDHASFVQPAIEMITKETGIALEDIDAVAVTAGPGSYTGLRVGLASAKGICYALQKPLILISTLEVMAAAIIRHAKLPLHVNSLLCPMIDARRMEVFTAMYSTTLDEIKSPYALILDDTSFSDIAVDREIVFSGSGSSKLKTLAIQNPVHFSDAQHTGADLVARALIAYHANQFADIAYCEPLYVKEFFTPQPSDNKRVKKY